MTKLCFIFAGLCLNGSLMSEQLSIAQKKP